MATKDVTLEDAPVRSDGKWASDNGVSIVARTVTSITDADSPYTAGTDEGVILADATAGVITVNLPAAANSKGMVLTVKKTGTGINAITLDPNGAELIDGGATYVGLDAAGDVATFVCNGTEWFLIGGLIA